MSAISAELALEISKFREGIKQANSALKSFKQSGEKEGSNLGKSIFSTFSSAAASIQPVLVASVTAAFAAASAVIAGGGILAAGVKQAFDLGGRLSDVAARLGTAAGKAQVLETAIANAGMEGESTATIINKMQDAIINAKDQASKKAAFQGLGLDIDQLKTMDSIDAFKNVGEAIGAIENPMERTKAAMEIFGRKGAELLVLFGDKGALDFAGEQVGRQAEIMTQVAGDFDRASDILGGMGKKVTGFFVGVGSKIVKDIMPALDALNKIDLAGLGERVGEVLSKAIKTVVAFFQEFSPEAAFKLGGDALILGVKTAVNFLWKGMFAVTTAFGELLIQSTKIGLQQFAILAKPEFWKGLMNTFVAIAITFGALLTMQVAAALKAFKQLPGLGRVIGNSDNAALNASNDLFKKAGEFTKKAGADFSPIVSEQLDQLGEAAGKVKDALIDGFKSQKGIFDTSKEQKSLANAVVRLGSRIATMSGQGAAAAAGAGGPGPASGPSRVAIGGIASAVNLIMGRSANEMILDETRKSNSVLESIDKHLDRIENNRQSNAKPAQPIVHNQTLKFA